MTHKRKKKSKTNSSVLSFKRSPHRTRSRSPTPSSESINSKDSWPSSTTSTSRSHSPASPLEIKPNNTNANVTKSFQYGYPPRCGKCGKNHPNKECKNQLQPVVTAKENTVLTTGAVLITHISARKKLTTKTQETN